MPHRQLTSLLKKSLEGAQRISILGVGSELRGDDIAGMLVARELQDRCATGNDTEHVQVLFGETAPENLTGEIKKFQPTHLIIVDAADTSAAAGTISIINPDNVGGISFSTHMMPLKLMVDYLNQSFPCTVIIIGIQPKHLSFGHEPSREVTQAVEEIIATLTILIKTLTFSDPKS
jgi:hydrogenase 3 maturation protease